MARVYPFPPSPRRTYFKVADPLVSGVRSEQLFDEAEFARRLNIFEARNKAEVLRKAGYRRTFGDWLTDTFESSFASGFVVGFIAGIVLVIVPFVVGAGS